MSKRWDSLEEHANSCWCQICPLSRAPEVFTCGYLLRPTGQSCSALAHLALCPSACSFSRFIHEFYLPTWGIFDGHPVLVEEHRYYRVDTHQLLIFRSNHQGPAVRVCPNFARCRHTGIFRASPTRCLVPWPSRVVTPRLQMAEGPLRASARQGSSVSVVWLAPGLHQAIVLPRFRSECGRRVIGCWRYGRCNDEQGLESIFAVL
ncbi:hypothetical protein V8C26DRAFT_354216 [Trichoderma gracile]